MAGPRQANTIDMQVQPGIFMQRSARQALGRYIDGDNVRWYLGLPQKMGGFQEELLIDTNGNRIWYQGHARSCHQWDSLDGQNWIAFGTEYKLYLINNARLYDITPIRQTDTIINGFATQAGSLVITVTDPSHNAQAGDFVTYSGMTPFGNVNVNGEWVIASIIDLNTYTIVYGVPVSVTNAGSGGAVVANYDISSGLTSDGTLSGYGTGGYGLEAYGTARSASTFGGFARIWSLDNWGEDLLAAPNGEALYWWQRQTGPDSRALLRPTAPANIERMLVGPDDRHVLALGTNLLSTDATTVTGQQDKMFVRWCEGDNFDNWVETTLNDAGSKRLDTGSRIITGVKTRTSIVIFSDECLYTVALVGGTDVYQITPLAQSVKIISPGAGVDVFGTVYYMTENGFAFYNGTVNDLPCDIADYVFGTKSDPTSGINRKMQSKVTCRVRLQFFEIHWSFPSNSSDENDSTAIYNWQLGIWYKSSIARESGLDKNVFFGVPIGFNDTGTYLEETGTDVSSEEALFNFLTTWEGEFAMTSRHDVPQNQTLWSMASGSMLMLLHSLIPDFKEMSGSVTLQVFGREFTGDATVYGDRLIVTPTTDQIDPQFCQRRVALYMESVTMGDYWRMDFWRAIASPVGRR
ncbi:MAG TPA: hypothetical protein VLH80_07465 [Nitrospiraceae bacterium]|nr:hypothetical protein [Nitrospiraceae bacterium]